MDIDGQGDTSLTRILLFVHLIQLITSVTKEQNGQQSVAAPALIVIIKTNFEGDSLGSHHMRLGLN